MCVCTVDSMIQFFSCLIKRSQAEKSVCISHSCRLYRNITGLCSVIFVCRRPKFVYSSIVIFTRTWSIHDFGLEYGSIKVPRFCLGRQNFLCCCYYINVNVPIMISVFCVPLSSINVSMVFMNCWASMHDNR